MKAEAKQELENILLACKRDNLTFKLRSLGVCERFYEGMISDYWSARIHELIELIMLQEQLIEQYRTNSSVDDELIGSLKRNLELTEKALAKTTKIMEVYKHMVIQDLKYHQL